MSDPKYLKPNNIEFCLSHVIEECGEVLQAAGKTQRWGWSSSNPETASDETNKEWLLREISNLEGAIMRLRKAMRYGGF